MMPAGTCPYDGTPIPMGTLQCPRCGTRFAPAVAAPPSSDGSKVVTIVVVVIVVMVALTVGSAAVLYIMVSGLIGGGGTSSPTMSWTGAAIAPGSPGGDDWEFRVASIDQNVDLGNYRVSILRGTSIVDGPETLRNGVLVLGTAGTTHLNVTDLDGGGRLSAGDTFILGNAQSGQTYHLVVLWAASGNEISRRTINT